MADPAGAARSEVHCGGRGRSRQVAACRGAERWYAVAERRAGPHRCNARAVVVLRRGASNEQPPERKYALSCAPRALNLFHDPGRGGYSTNVRGMSTSPRRPRKRTAGAHSSMSRQHAFSDNELVRLRIEYEQLKTAWQQPEVTYPGEDEWTKAANRVQANLRSDARADAWSAQLRAAKAKRVAANAYAPWSGTPWKLAAVADESLSRAAATAVERSAIGLGAVARAAVGRAEASERAEQVTTLREQHVAKKIHMRQQREAVWAAEQDQRQRQEQRRTAAAQAHEAREEAWRAELQRRESHKEQDKARKDHAEAERIAEAAAQEEQLARRIAQNLVRIFDADGNNRIDGARPIASLFTSRLPRRGRAARPTPRRRPTGGTSSRLAASPRECAAPSPGVAPACAVGRRRVQKADAHVRRGWRRQPRPHRTQADRRAHSATLSPRGSSSRRRGTENSCAVNVEGRRVHGCILPWRWGMEYVRATRLGCERRSVLLLDGEAEPGAAGGHSVPACGR